MLRFLRPDGTIGPLFGIFIGPAKRYYQLPAVFLLWLFFDKRRSIIAKGFEKIPFVTDGISWQLSWSAAKDLWSNLRIENCWPPYFVLSLDGVEGPRLPLIMAPQDQNAKWLKNEDSSKLNIMLPNCKIANSSTNDFSILILTEDELLHAFSSEKKNLVREIT